MVLMVRYENLLTKNLEDMEEQVNGQANEANNYKSHILAYRNKKVTAGDLENWLDKIEKKETPKEEKESLKQQVAEFVYNRLYERYIEPFLILSEINYDENWKKKVEKELNISEAGASNFNLKLGFSIMSNMCLLMETIQSFRDGIRDSHGQESDMFKKFIEKYGETHFALARDEKIKLANTTKGDIYSFYQNIRNGILHQGETKKGWRINNGDKAIDVAKKLIDAKLFKDEMLKILKEIRENIKTNNTLAINCTKKVNAIINNCQ